MIKHLNGNELDAFVAANKRVVVDFYADWCNPCKILGRELEEFEPEHPDFVIAKINVDENEECYAQFGEQSIPLLVFFENGKAVKKVVGYIPAKRVWDIYNG